MTDHFSTRNLPLDTDEPERQHNAGPFIKGSFLIADRIPHPVAIAAATIGGAS